MRWSNAGLMLLGVVAAGCAAVLVASIRSEKVARGQTGTDENVLAVVVTRDMPAMSIVEEQTLEEKTIPGAAAPVGFFTNTASLIGRSLAVPVKKGQVLTRGDFAEKDPLATILPNGMRAVNLELSRPDVMIMSPGSVVDVLVSFKVPSQSKRNREEAVAMTLLQGVEILAINGKSVTAGETDETKKRTVAASKSCVVTLMVDSTQAKALQLAKKHGTVTLALRNPLDDQPVSTDLTRLSELSDEYSGLLALVAAAQAKAGSEDEIATESFTEALEERPAAVPSRKLWEIEVDRGGAVEKRVFLLPGDRHKPGTIASPLENQKDRAQREVSRSIGTAPSVKKASDKGGDVK